MMMIDYCLMPQVTFSQFRRHTASRCLPALEDDGEAEDVLVLHLSVGQLLHLLDEAHPLLDGLLMVAASKNRKT